VAEQFTGTPGVYVKIEDSIRGFKEILEGKHDDLPERAFFMKGTIDQVVAEAGEVEDEDEESKSDEDSDEGEKDKSGEKDESGESSRSESDEESESEERSSEGDESEDQG
jgi:hypothetical protein